MTQNAYQGIYWNLAPNRQWWHFLISHVKFGQPGWLSGLVLPSAQGLILQTRDRVPCQAPCVEPAFPLLVSLPLSLSLCLMNK